MITIDKQIEAVKREIYQLRLAVDDVSKSHEMKPRWEQDIINLEAVISTLEQVNKFIDGDILPEEYINKASELKSIGHSVGMRLAKSIYESKLKEFFQ